MADVVRAVADVVADGATDLVTGATAPVVSEEDLVVALVVVVPTSNFVRFARPHSQRENATLSKRELYDYLCAVANYSFFTLHSSL